MSKLFGSVTNRIWENTISQIPEVGMGVTEYCWSDRHAYEITKVIDDRHIIVRRLDHSIKSEGGIFGVQDYEFYSNDMYPSIKLFRNKNGQWKERIGSHGIGCNVFVVGHADEYYDPSF